MIFDDTKSYSMTTVYLKAIPEDLAKHILKIQLELRTQKGINKYSQSQAILHIIREHKKQSDVKK